MRPVILHGHMFKNGGTTLDHALQRNFGEKFLDHRDDDRMRTGGENYLWQVLAQDEELCSLSSHHLPCPINGNSKFDSFVILLIREPIERADSVYEFERAQDEDTQGALFASTHGFKDYVYWRNSEGAGRTISNYQVRYCSGQKSHKLGELDLHAAIDYLKEKKSLVGVVDRYEESMLCIEHQLKGVFPRIDLSYISQNINLARIDVNGVRPSYEQVLEKSGSAGATLLNSNVLDAALYSESNKLLDSLITSIPDWEKELRDFRRRCEDKLSKQLRKESSMSSLIRRFWRKLRT